MTREKKQFLIKLICGIVGAIIVSLLVIYLLRLVDFSPTEDQWRGLMLH